MSSNEFPDSILEFFAKVKKLYTTHVQNSPFELEMLQKGFALSP